MRLSTPIPLGLAAAQLRVVRVAGGPEATGAGDDSLEGAPRHDADEAELAPTAGVTARPPERRRVRMVAGLALGVVLALAGITAVELIIGHPVSGSTTSGTTIGQAVGGRATGGTVGHASRVAYHDDERPVGHGHCRDRICHLGRVTHRDSRAA